MDYIIRHNGSAHRYFYREREGIMTAREESLFLPERIFRDAKGPFCVYERGGIANLIAVGKKNELIYLKKKDSEYKRYVLCELAGDLNVLEIKTVQVGERTDLLCSAGYKEDILLIHCVLGNQAKPSVIDKMSGGYFYPYNKKVYYTNQNKDLGFQDLSDGKPERFCLIASQAEDIYIRAFGHDEYMVYKKDDMIYLNHIPKFKCQDIHNPILCRRGNETVLIFKSGRVLKYADINGGKEATLKKIVSSSEMILCSVSENGENYYEYAANGSGQPYFFEVPQSNSKKEINSKKEEYDKLNADLIKLKQEVQILEDKIRNL